jgi:hypothetical protein
MLTEGAHVFNRLRTTGLKHPKCQKLIPFWDMPEGLSHEVKEEWPKIKITPFWAHFEKCMKVLSVM